MQSKSSKVSDWITSEELLAFGTDSTSFNHTFDSFDADTGDESVSVGVQIWRTGGRIVHQDFHKRPLSRDLCSEKSKVVFFNSNLSESIN